MDKESSVIVSKNLADEAPLGAQQLLTAAVTLTPRGRCEETGERRTREPMPRETEVCLRFVDNVLGTLRDLPRYTLPLFADKTANKPDKAAYRAVRVYAREPSGELTFEFSQRPTRWGIDKPQAGSPFTATIPKILARNESASTRILDRVPLGTGHLVDDANDQRWQYRQRDLTKRDPTVRDLTVKYLQISEDPVRLTTIQPGDEVPKPIAIPTREIVAEPTGSQKKSCPRDMRWALSDSGDRILVGNGSKFHELGLGADGSYSGKPWVSDLKSVAQSEGCRRKEEEKALSFQMIKDWPGKNPAFIALDLWGRVWRIPAHTEKSRNNATGDQSQADSSSGTETPSQDPAPRIAGSSSEPDRASQAASAAKTIVCVTQSKLDLPVIALDSSGRALVQLDRKILHVIELSDGDLAGPPSSGPLSTPFLDDVVAATFVPNEQTAALKPDNQSAAREPADRIAVLHKGGLLSLFERANGLWTLKSTLDVGFVHDLDAKPCPRFSSINAGKLAVFHRNSSIVIDLAEENDFSIIAAGTLPGPLDLMKLLAFKDAQLDVFQRPILRVQLPAVPPRASLARIGCPLPPRRRPGQMAVQAQLQTMVYSEDGTAAPLKRKRQAALGIATAAARS